MNELTAWSTTAVNLGDHADNIIHTDEGARAAGFESALVAGTTVYAYMTHPVVAAWGQSWLSGGGGELRLRSPVFDRDPVDCLITDGPTVTATVGGNARASLELWQEVDAPTVRDGDSLRPFDVTLAESHLDYGMRAGDDLELYASEAIAHPVTWANLANSVFIDNLITGPWIHVRSKIYHEGLATLGSRVHIEANLVKRFDSRAGERALVDMRFYADEQPVATIEHEAIIVLRQ